MQPGSTRTRIVESSCFPARRVHGAPPLMPYAFAGSNQMGAFIVSKARKLEVGGLDLERPLDGGAGRFWHQREFWFVSRRGMRTRNHTRRIQAARLLMGLSRDSELGLRGRAEGGCPGKPGGLF